MNTIDDYDANCLRSVHQKHGFTGQMRRLQRSGLICRKKSRPTSIGGVVGIYAMTPAGMAALAKYDQMMAE